MPAHDFYHDAVRNALIKDGWTITHDPFTIAYGSEDVYIDFGAERIIAADRESERIAVEVKSFRGHSQMHDFEIAVGQYIVYRSLLVRIAPERKLFLGVPIAVYSTFFQVQIARPALEDHQIPILAFDPQTEVIVKWTK